MNLLASFSTKVMLLFFIMFSFYIHLSGGSSAGGGFQAGMLFATSFILCSLGFSNSAIKNILSIKNIKWIILFSCTGLLVYIVVGLASMLFGGSFLDYSAYSSVFNVMSKTSQSICIFIVESSIFCVVSSSAILIYLSIKNICS